MGELTPTPGSEEATAAGCTCPVIDNHHGRGWNGMDGAFVYTSGCPVHWPVGTTEGPFIAVDAPIRKEIMGGADHE